MIDEAKVFERHGVSGTNKWVHASDIGRSIQICVGVDHAEISADCALRLASMLRRLARRVKARTPHDQ